MTTIAHNSIIIFLNKLITIIVLIVSTAKLIYLRLEMNQKMCRESFALLNRGEPSYDKFVTYLRIIKQDVEHNMAS